MDALQRATAELVDMLVRARGLDGGAIEYLLELARILSRLDRLRS
jgi:hypothetical protein